MNAHLGHGGQHAAHGAQGGEDGVAGCGGPADDGPSNGGETAGTQQQRLRCVCVAVHRRYPLRVPGPGSLLSTLDRRWVETVARNTNMGPVACVPLLGELPAARLDALPAPCTPPPVADIAHEAGLPEARLQQTILCMAAADVGTSLVVSVTL